MKILKEVLNFFFPFQCEVCGRLLGEQEKIICLYCFLELPRTNFHNSPENVVSQLFWGRVNISHSASWFYFTKGSPYQKLIHKLKYKGRKDIGFELGKVYGHELKGSPFVKADIIIPVPLHPSRLKKRGYNQSEFIGMGLAETLAIPIKADNLIRENSTESQTRKNRFERFLNMEGKFKVKDVNQVLGKSILLVDDVVTTGSTLEACATILLEAGCLEVNVLTLAVA